MNDALGDPLVIAESLEILARALHVKNAELEPTLEAIASTAVTMLSPARYAGLTILSRGELIPRATTGEPPLLLDRLQQRLGDGPCISAAKHQSVFRIEDTLQDLRWPEFNAEAARLKVRSMLCVPLWIDERGLGALSLYADQAAAFSGSFIGLLLGGVLAPINWRLIFLVSVPVGLLGTVLGYLKLRELSDRRPARIDWPCNITFALGHAGDVGAVG